jgi:hypothetical protein
MKRKNMKRKNKQVPKEIISQLANAQLLTFNS